MTDCFFICATQHSSRAINRLWLAARRLKGKRERGVTEVEVEEEEGGQAKGEKTKMSKEAEEQNE